jgi:hypothetical protein
VAVSIERNEGGQVIGVKVEDPTGRDLMGFQAAQGVEPQEITFKAETDGKYNIVVAQMDSRGAPVDAIVNYYPAGSW